MQDEKPKLTIKQESCIVELVAHGEVLKAAKAVGVNPSTVHRWLKEPLFSSALNEARGRVWLNTIESLKGASAEAIATLRANLKAKSRSIRNTAARNILEFSFRAVQLIEHEQRIADLEAALEIQSIQKQR